MDEIGELPLTTQVAFLRVLQDRRVKPVGSPSEVDVDCRVIAATNRDLMAEIEAGNFREDLYYRLNVIQLELPPLRERGHDVKDLIEHYMAYYAEQMNRPIRGIAASALRVLLNYPYPGNVRELQNIMERAVTLTDGEMIDLEALPYRMQDGSLDRVTQEMAIPEEGIDLEGMVAKLETTMIKKALQRSGGVRKEAAKLLGITFRSMRYRLDKYGIDPDKMDTWAV